MDGMGWDGVDLNMGWDEYRLSNCLGCGFRPAGRMQLLLTRPDLDSTWEMYGVRISSRTDFESKITEVWNHGSSQVGPRYQML